MKSLNVLAACLCLVLPAFAAPPPKVVSAADGIFAAFQTHPLVGIGEWHGLAQELDFYSMVVRDPRFARDVSNVVLETGDAAQQAVVDRYVDGENVPYAELRKVWSDTVGWFPTVSSLGSINLYGTIRAVNQTLPPQNRIKVWLGEPPIDWSRIKTRGDWQPVEEQGDSYPAALIEREILSKGKKALVIYGAGHLGVYPGYDNLRARLERQSPGALFIVAPYVGYAENACAALFERHIHRWPVPALISPVRGSSLEKDTYRPGCSAFALPAHMTEEQKKGFETSGPNNAGLTSDALLYLGPRKSLLISPNVPDSYFDLDYRVELDRRMRLRTGNGMDAPDPAKYNPATPLPYWKN